jgi:hypothetical protein
MSSPPVLIDPDDRGVSGALAREHPCFDIDIVLDRAMPVEMVGRDIGEDAGIGA